MVFTISFDRPECLWFLFSIPLLVFTHLYFMHHAKRKAIRFGNFRTIERVTGKRILTTNSLLLLVRSFVLILVILSLSGITLWHNVTVGRSAVVIAIDTSASMSATDMNGSRVDAAKAAARDFVNSLDESVQIGVVQYSGLAEVLQVPTRNRDDVLAAIDKVEIKTIGGTDIAGGIVTAVNLLATSTDGKVILLMTDGVASVSLYDSNPVDRSIAYATQNHVIIDTIGIGTQTAGFLPGLANESASYDEQNLHAIADGTGGLYSWAHDQTQLKAAYQNVSENGSVEMLPVRLWLGFLFAAIAALFIEWGLVNTRYRLLP